MLFKVDFLKEIYFRLRKKCQIVKCCARGLGTAYPQRLHLQC